MRNPLVPFTALHKKVAVSAALAVGVVLSACSGGTGSSSALPSSGAQALAMSHGHALVPRPMPGVKVLTGLECPGQYFVCFYVYPGNPGPYVETIGDGAPLYGYAYIVSNKKPNKIDKKFDQYFYPNPGDPIDTYIDYSGKNPKKPGKVEFTDYWCVSYSESGCSSGGSYLLLGIALAPSGG